MLQFRKYHGLGNDFVLVDARRTGALDLGRDTISRLCDRRFGVGADGLIVVLPPQRDGDLRMRIFNADASEPEMCGNGIRCLARFIADLDDAPAGSCWRVETLAGVISPELLEDGQVRVDMGEPCLSPETVPTTLAAGRDRAIDQPLLVDGELLRVSAIGMGNPHAVVPVPDLETFDVEGLGAVLERHPAFPARTNAGFVQILAPDRLRLRVWERGAGPTLACGTGACAALVAAHLLGLCRREATVELPGGPLLIAWGDDNRLGMTGPARCVFTAQLDTRQLEAAPAGAAMGSRQPVPATAAVTPAAPDHS